jgi:hypothetical protein
VASVSAQHPMAMRVMTGMRLITLYELANRLLLRFVVRLRSAGKNI